jgi:hypothetical protein
MFAAIEQSHLDRRFLHAYPLEQSMFLPCFAFRFRCVRAANEANDELIARHQRMAIQEGRRRVEDVEDALV